MQAVVHLDLVRLAQSLTTNEQHPDLVRAVDRAAAAGSIRADLQAAQAAIQLIDELLAQSERPTGIIPTGLPQSTLIGALFTHAIVLYARATTTSGARPKLLGEAKLTADQRAVHREAMKLRDSAIAHFGRGDEWSDGPLVREAVLLSLFRSPTGPKHRVGVYTTRAQHKVAFADRLTGLIEVRLEELATRQQQLFDAAEQALDAAVKLDRTLGSSLPKFAFDAEAFCPSQEAAALMREQLDAGEMNDIDYTVKKSRL